MTANNYAIQLIASSKDRIDFGSTAKGTTIKDLSTFTLEMDVKHGNNTNPEARAYLERQGSGKLPRLALTTFNDTSGKKGVLRFEFSRRDNKSDTNYNYTLPNYWDDYWHHVAFTVDVGEKNYNIYLDGALVAVGKVPDGGKDGSNNPLKVANTTPLDIIIGAGYNGSTYTYWDGKIDNIRLWNNVQSQSAIISNAYDHIPSPGSVSSLIEEWRLNEGTGTSTVGIKNASWSAALKRNGAASSALWTVDRPWMGDLNDDEIAPTAPTVTAHTNITADGFTLNFSGSTDNVYVQYYEITVATDSAFTAPVSGYSGKNVGLVTSYTVSGLTPATNYYARVRAVDAGLNGSAFATYNSNAVIVTSATGDVLAPNAPVATAASSTTYLGFTANWNASTSPDETGYKLDVATDSNFVDIVPSYRNLDVGNVLTYPINLGILSATTYYYRIRAYDAAGNESIDSNVITVTTAQPPDTTPPNVVVLKPATSVASTSFTANWEEGSDNVGVTGYRIDLSQDVDFLSYVVSNLNVGNVTSYAFSGLSVATTYYYRVRAYDAAGNVSANTDSPEQVNTLVSLIDQGEAMYVQVDCGMDTYVEEDNTGSNQNNSDLFWLGGTAGSRHWAVLQFDLTGITGEIVNADLALWVDTYAGVPTGNHTVEVYTGTWDGEILNWSNFASTLTLVPGSVAFNWVTTNEYVTVDIASILTLGPALYTIVVKPPVNESSILYTREHSSGNIPKLTVNVDPTTATQLETITPTATNLNYTNLLKNPSAEIGGTAFGGTTGITAIGAVTLLQSPTYAYSGLYSCSVTTPATTATGVNFASNTGLAIAGTGQVIKAGAYITAASIVTGLQIQLRLTYTDTTTTTGTAVAVQTMDTGRWARFECSATATSGKTVDKVEILITQTTAAARTFFVDACIVANTLYDLIYFDGSTNTDTDWDGTAHASTSTLVAVKIDAESTYLGDSDDDNSVVGTFTENGKIYPLQTAAGINRSLKKATFTVPPVRRSNELFNPSFTFSLANWTTAGAASGFTRLDGVGVGEADAIGVACATFRTTGTGMGIANTDFTWALVGQVWTFSAYVKCNTAQSVKLQILEIDSTLTGIGTWESTTTTPVGEWVRLSITATLTNANTRWIRCRVISNTASTVDWFVDDCQLVKQTAITTYNSGDVEGGQYSGTFGASDSWYRIRHLEEYGVEFAWADTDGIVGTTPQIAYVTTPAKPEDNTTLDTLTVDAQATALGVTFTYIGDSNNNATFYVNYKRSDLSNWNNAIYSLNRSTKTLTAYIGGLRPGVQYDVRVTATEVDDKVFGGTANNSKSAYMIVSATTLVNTDESGVSSTLVSFGGFILQNDSVDWISITYHDAFDLPDRDVQVEKLARTHGSVELSEWWDRKQITIKGIVKANSRVELEDRIREFRRALAPKQQQLIVDTLDSNGYYWIATCESLQMPEQAGEHIRHLEWTAKFVCADPFRYSPTDTVESAINLANNDTVGITNDGDLLIYPTYEITTKNSTATQVSLFNQTSGERMTPSVTIRSGDKLIINSGTTTVLKNGVRVDYEGSFPTLKAGPNTLKVTVSTGSIYLTVKRRHRYF